MHNKVFHPFIQITSSQDLTFRRPAGCTNAQDKHWHFGTVSPLSSIIDLR